MTTAEEFEDARHLATKEPLKAIEKYKQFLAQINGFYMIILGKTDAVSVKTTEIAIAALGELYKDQRKPNELALLMKSSLKSLVHLSKAKTAKISIPYLILVKNLIDSFSEIPGSLPLQVTVCKEAIDWAVQEKRIFLRQSLETRLCSLYLDNKMYTEALSLTDQLLKELKRLDDKNVLMEVQLLESRVYHALRNLAKAKAALTAARTSANSIYCPPLVQAAIDMQSGILHAEEKDYKTAYSYFYETMETFTGQEDPRGLLGLKYMLLCKIMLNLPEDVHNIINGKLAIKHSGADIEAMNAIATALEHRSLQEFESVLTKHKAGNILCNVLELGNDPIVRNHLAALYDTLLEQNLLRIIEPFSRVEIAHVAELVKLPTIQVENKLSQMILDKIFYGILDQGAGCLEVFDEPSSDKTYEATIDTIKNMEQVVNSLYLKAGNLNM